MGVLSFTYSNQTLAQASKAAIAALQAQLGGVGGVDPRQNSGGQGRSLHPIRGKSNKTIRTNPTRKSISSSKAVGSYGSVRRVLLEVPLCIRHKYFIHGSFSFFAGLLYPEPRAAGNFVPGFGHGEFNRDSTLQLGSPTGSEFSTKARGPSTYPSVPSFDETAMAPTQKSQQVPDVAEQGLPELPKDNVETSRVGETRGDKPNEGEVDADKPNEGEVDGTPSPAAVPAVPVVGDIKSGGPPKDPTTKGGNDGAPQIMPASGSTGAADVGKENANMTGSGTLPKQSTPENLGNGPVLPKGSSGETKKKGTTPPAPAETPDDLNTNIYDNGFYWKTLNSI